jgi:hypothetical protein
MTRDDIIRWAREAGWSEIGADLWGATNDGAMSIYALERFAALVAAAEREACAAKLQSLRAQAYRDGHKAGNQAEREACAKVCESMPWVSGKSLPSNVEMAAAIRARGQA